MTKSFEEIEGLITKLADKLLACERLRLLQYHLDKTKSVRFEILESFKELCNENERLKEEIKILKGVGHD